MPHVMRARSLPALILALSWAPLAPAFAGHGGHPHAYASPEIYETYAGARSDARTRARKVCRQEREYRTLEDKRLARDGIARRDRPPPPSYASYWSRCRTAGAS